MSALAKPGAFTPNSDAGANSAMVNLDHVKDISVVDVPALGDNGKATYKIIFSILSTDNQPKTVEWLYRNVATAKTARDADYAAVVALFAVSL